MGFPDLAHRGTTASAPTSRRGEGMGAKNFCLGAWALTFFAVVSASAQDPAIPAAGPVTGLPEPDKPGAPVSLASPLPSVTACCWSSGGQASCCGPLGDSLPRRTEFSLRAGPSIPVGQSVLSDVLDTGWMIEGNGRVEFFNQR